MLRTLAFEQLNAPAVKLKLLKFNAPFVKLTVRVDPIVRLSCNCKVAPGEFWVSGDPIVIPFVVIVWVDVPPKVCVTLVDVQVIPDPSVKLPKIVVAFAAVKVPAKPVKFKFFTRLLL